MSKEQNVVNYYILCNKLKDVVRSGWKRWNVQRERVESIAEHVYGVQMLAIGMKSEYQYDIDIMKVIYMIAIHELGEILIGDLTPFDDKKDKKGKIEHQAVHRILSPLIDGDKIEALFLEYDEHKTPEAKFAYQCDKLECDIQCKLYDLEGCVDLNHQENNQAINIQEIKELLSDGKSWSDMWLSYWQMTNVYDKNFMDVSQYVKNNSIVDYSSKQHRMNTKFVEQWLQQLKNYWYNKDVDKAVSLFNKTIYYQKTPFMKPYTTLDEMRKEWQHIKDEDIQNIEFNILAINYNTAIVNWILKQNNEDYNGIYEIKFDDELNCIYFRSWESEKYN